MGRMKDPLGGLKPTRPFDLFDHKQEKVVDRKDFTLEESSTTPFKMEETQAEEPKKEE